MTFYNLSHVNRHFGDQRAFICRALIGFGNRNLCFLPFLWRNKTKVEDLLTAFHSLLFFFEETYGSFKVEVDCDCSYQMNEFRLMLKEIEPASDVGMRKQSILIGRSDEFKQSRICKDISRRWVASTSQKHFFFQSTVDISGDVNGALDFVEFADNLFSL